MKALQTLMRWFTRNRAPEQQEPTIAVKPPVKVLVKTEKPPKREVPAKKKPQSYVHGSVELDGSLGEYFKKLETATPSDASDTYISLIGDVVKISRIANGSALAIFNYTSDVSGDKNTHVSQSVTVMVNTDGRWKKLFTNPMILSRLDSFATEFELAFEQHGFTSHHNSSKLLVNFIETVFIPILAKQMKMQHESPDKRTHLRLTMKAYTDNPANPQDCPSIVTTVTYTEDNTPSSVSLSMKYQKAMTHKVI